MSKINLLINEYNEKLKKSKICEVDNTRSKIFEFFINNKCPLQEKEMYHILEQKYINVFKNKFTSNYKELFNYELKYFDHEYYEFKQKEYELINADNMDISKLITVRNNISKNKGFLNYYEFMNVEDRRYFLSHREIKKLRKFVKKYIISLNESLDSCSFDEYDLSLKKIKTFIGNEYGLKNLNIDYVKDDVWKTAYYPYSNRIELHTKYKNNEKDIFNLSHEYGHIFHLNYNYECFDLPFLDYSISEIFSSYSEAICINEVGNIDLINNHIKRIIEIIITSVVSDEFIQYLYSNPKVTNKDRNLMWEQINKKYNHIPRKKWNEDINRIIYPYHGIDYALAYISTLSVYSGASIYNLYSMRKDASFMLHTKFVKKYLNNPFERTTYKKIKKEIGRLKYEN